MEHYEIKNGMWHWPSFYNIPNLFCFLSLSYTIFIFSFVLLFLITFRLCDALASIPCSLFHYPQPLSLHPPSSIPCPPFHPPLLCHSVTLVSILHPLSLSHHLFCISVFQLLASLFHSILIFPTSVHYSLPSHSDFIYSTFCPLWLCESFSTFSVLPCLPLMRSTGVQAVQGT